MNKRIPALMFGSDVFVDDDIFISNNMSIAHPNAMIVDNEVRVNQAFLQASDETQRVMIAHELGHIHHKHDSNQRDIVEEIEADLYAVSLVGKELVFSVLKSMLFKVANAGHVRSMNELIIRMCALERI